MAHMSQKKLHIISFNVPYPPNYGGVIDVYYKIKALHELGIKIILHCYSYGRQANAELESLTEKTYYYQRKTGLRSQLSRLPYIVKSRADQKLLKRLVADNYPILFEGLHCCYFLNHPELAKRKKVVRTHNIEHEYYRGLYLQEKKLKARLFFGLEAKKLQRFEAVLKQASAIAAISDKDREHFKHYCKQSITIAPFHSNTSYSMSLEQSDYLLYHGNLEVAENVEAAMFLIKAFAQEEDIRLIIAGHKPHRSLIEAVKGLSHIQLISSPGDMKSLIREAQVNILPTFQATGVKLKLLEALFCGKHLLCNAHMVSGTGLDSICHLAESQEDFVALAKKLLKIPFTARDIEKRQAILDKNYSPHKNAQKLVNLIFEA